MSNTTELSKAAIWRAFWHPRIISSVPKRIVGSENGALQRRVTGCNGCCAVAPCVVSVSADLDTRFGIHRYNIAEDVFFKVECVKYACGITALAVLQTHGCAALVVKIQEHPLSPRFADNLRAVEDIGVYRTTDVFARADSFIVISEGGHGLAIVAVHFHKLAAAPRQGILLRNGRIENFYAT